MELSSNIIAFIPPPLSIGCLLEVTSAYTFCAHGRIVAGLPHMSTDSPSINSHPRTQPHACAHTKWLIHSPVSPHQNTHNLTFSSHFSTTSGLFTYSLTLWVELLFPIFCSRRSCEGHLTELTNPVLHSRHALYCLLVHCSINVRVCAFHIHLFDNSGNKIVQFYLSDWYFKLHEYFT